jgi:hypothetical protein
LATIKAPRSWARIDARQAPADCVKRIKNIMYDQATFDLTQAGK